MVPVSPWTVPEIGTVPGVLRGPETSERRNVGASEPKSKVGTEVGTIGVSRRWRGVKLHSVRVPLTESKHTGTELNCRNRDEGATC